MDSSYVNLQIDMHHIQELDEMVHWSGFLDYV